jgi:hypothetical protein
MGTPKHVLALIHGITPEREPRVMEQYRDFMAAVQQSGLPFEAPICQVTWGVPDADGTRRRPDQHLTAAEAFLATLVEQAEIEKIDRPENELDHGVRDHDWGVPGLRAVIRRIRESVVHYGLSDAVYYAAPEGEQAIRDAVFEQVLGKLEAEKDGEIHLHILAHSLGVTIAHDFLYSLFGTRDPDYPTQPDSEDPYRLDADTRAMQRRWRVEAEAGRLKLGTFLSFASQLPLFILRKQALVERFANKQRLDPRVIGIDPSRNRIQWAIFYDTDEVLGFPTRQLYQDTPAIHDIQVNSGVEPLAAHLGYWHKPRVIERCLKILGDNITAAGAR